jgi:ribose transport system substrate-binding protein
MRKTFYWFIVTLVIISIIALFTLNGCKTESAGEETGAVEEEEATAEEVEYNFVMWWPIAHPFCDLLEKGLDQFEEDYGIKVDISLGTEPSLEEELQMLEGLAAQGYNGIMAYPMDSTAINAAYQEIIDEGIVAVNYCAPVNEPTPVPFTVATDVKNQGVLATEKVIEEMGEKGNIVNILEQLLDPNTVLRKEGVEETVAKYPDVQIIQEVAGMQLLDECTEKITNAMAALGDQIDGMVTTGVNPTIALSQIMIENENNTIAYVGCDVDEVTEQGIREGYVTGTFAQNPYCIAYTSALLMKLLVDGYTPKEEGYVFIDAGGLIVTKENIDTYDDLLWDAAYDKAEEIYDYLTPPSN